MRKLVTLRQVNSIESIPEADRIEIAHIDGWQCVVRKGEFQVGDTGVYFEIDSFLPLPDPRFDFLEKDSKIWKGKKGVRLRTKKFKKALAQGLLLPLKDFPELQGKSLNEDVSELLGVVKWELPEPSALMSRDKRYRNYDFPYFIPKTDEERVQNIPDVIERNKDAIFEVTEKLDGTSCTFFFGGPDEEFGVCSRNVWLKKRHDWWISKVIRWIKSFWKPTYDLVRINSYWLLAKEYKLDEILPKFCKESNRHLALQGEIIGVGIQNNYYKFGVVPTNTNVPYANKHGQEFYVFSIYDIDQGRYLNPSERSVELFILNSTYHLNFNLKHVPILGYISLDKFNSIDDILLYADGKSVINGKVLREGVVFKRMDGKFHFKAVSNKFLLGEKD